VSGPQVVKQALAEIEPSDDRGKSKFDKLIRERRPSRYLETKHPVRFTKNGGRTWKKATPGMSESEHHAMGAWLNEIKAIATAYRYGRYAKGSKIGRGFDRMIKAVDGLREALVEEFGWVVAANLLPQEEKGWGEIRWNAAGAASWSIYDNPEMRELRDFVVEELQAGPPDQALRALGIPVEEYQDGQRGRFQHVVREAVLSTHDPLRLPILWEETTRALRLQGPIAVPTSGRLFSKTLTNPKPRSSQSSASTRTRCGATGASWKMPRRSHTWSTGTRPEDHYSWRGPRGLV
jgi:hypothetical protein